MAGGEVTNFSVENAEIGRDTSLTKRRCNKYPHWCLQNTVLLTLIGVVIVICISIYLHRLWAEKPEFCKTTACIKRATEVLSYRDTTAEPCDNFYRYACGNWDRHNFIEDDRSSENVFSKLTRRVTQQLKVIVEKESPVEEIAAIKKAKAYYGSCMNTDKISARGIDPMKDLLISKFGGWPVLKENSDDSSNRSLTEYFSALEPLGAGALFKFDLYPDIMSSNVYRLSLFQRSPILEKRPYYLSDHYTHIRQAYIEFATNVAVLFGANREKAETQMMEMVEFEIQFVNISKPRDIRRNFKLLYRKFTLDDLHNHYSFDLMDWLTYFQKVVAEADKTIAVSEEIIMYDEEFFDKLKALLNATNIRTVVNYLLFNVIYTSGDALGGEYTKLFNTLVKVIDGSQEKPRSRKCLDEVHWNFPFVVGRLYVDEYVDKNIKSKFRSLTDNIRSSFNEILHEITWMDNATRIKAREKANAVIVSIGYPDKLMDNVYLNNITEKLEMNLTDYFGNFLTATREDFMKNLNLLDTTLDRNKWLEGPAIVNAFFTNSFNQIMMPAGILQPPFYHGDYPSALNYGAIGAIVGHELTHGFDARGKDYDKDGLTTEWWTDDVFQSYDEKSICMKEQYGNYTVTVNNHTFRANANIQQNENIADNGGVKQAYRAFRQLMASTGENLHLPAVKLTQNQLFFLSFAQNWCTNVREIAFKDAVENNPHSYGEFRANGPLSNMKEFSEAFGCSSESKMNPKRKCSLW